MTSYNIFIHMKLYKIIYSDKNPDSLLLVCDDLRFAESFLDRLFYVTLSNGGMFRHKVGAAVVAVRRSGGSSTLDCLNHYITYSEMMLASSNYWNIIHGTTPGDATQDSEGVQIMEELGNNMAWQLKMREMTKDTLSEPERAQKVMMSFIR